MSNSKPAQRARSLLRKRIIAALSDQGFRLHDDVLLPPKDLSKDELRGLHQPAVEHRLTRIDPRIRRNEQKLLSRIANGYEIVPRFIRPRLIEVQPRTSDELLFRYISLHWSIPVSSGYGRRLRFLVIDDQNGKVMGAFGLGDPVFNLGARDNWIGWNRDAKTERLHNVMEAFLVGAVPTSR